LSLPLAASLKKICARPFATARETTSCWRALLVDPFWLETEERWLNYREL